METTLFSITIILLVAVTAINLVLPLAHWLRVRHLNRTAKLDTVKRLYGLHYQRNHSLTSGKE